MTHRRVVTIAGIVGCIGALVTFVAWRSFARRLLVVAPVAADSIQRCPEIIDSGYALSIQNARPQILAVLREKRIPGMSVSVAVDGRIVWSEGFGFADAERRVPACPETRFRIASVSKPVTAAVMAKLADERRLDIDAPVSLYVPAFPNGDRITPRHLASHRSGIRHYRDDMEAYTKVQFGNLRESLAIFQNDSLLFAPDTKHEYSSYGYALLGAALEGASGQEFGALIERVVRPLGMDHTTVDRNDTTLTGVTRFYDHVTPYVTDGQVHPSPFVAMSSKWASGGMLSTTDDLVRFGSALLPDSRAPLLADSTRETLFTPRTRATPPIFGYALGWMTFRDIDFRQVYMHFGAGSGATSWLGIFPDQRVVVAVLANLGHAGFAYASTIGIGTRFMPKALPAIAIVLFTSFIAFALAAYVAIKLAQFLSRSLRRPAA